MTAAQVTQDARGADGYGWKTVVDKVEEYKKLLRDARYMCKKCGRAAAKAKCLCKPVKL